MALPNRDALEQTRRKRSRSLADIEKPTIHVGLVLNGVSPGVESPFLQFFGDLSPEDAAQTVEKLAAQSEERILAQAEAARHPPGR